MNLIGLIGIILGIAFLIYSALKGYETLYTVIPVVLLIALTNGLNLTDSLVTTMMEGASQYFVTLLPLILTGMIFAGIYSMCGAAKTIAMGLLGFFENLLKPKAGSEYKTGIWVTIIVLTIVGSAFGYLGLDGMVVMVTVMPIAVQMLKRYDVPRVVLPTLLYLNMWTAGMPYSIATTNVIHAQILGTSMGAAGLPGIVGGVISLILVLIFANYYLNRKRATGMGFVSMPDLDMEMDDSIQIPHFFVALIPFAIIFVLALAIKLNMVLCLCIGIVLEIILFFPQLKAVAENKQSTILLTLRDNANHQAVFAAQITVTVVLLVGYAAVIRETSTFNWIITALTTGSGVMLYVNCAIAMMVAIFLCVNPIAGMLTNLGTIAPYFIEAGVPAAAVHRMSLVAATVFDSLPTSAGIMVAHRITGVKMRDGYGGVFVVTVLIPFINMCIITALSAIMGA